MLNNQYTSPLKQLHPRESALYTAAEDNWHYSHHAFLGAYKGRIYAMWSSCMENEDDIGQRILYTTTQDGIHWNKPEILFTPPAGNYALTGAGFYVSPQGLVAYGGRYCYPPELVVDGHCTELGKSHVDTGLYARITEDGVHFSEPVDLSLPVVPNISPQRLASGRLLMCGNISFPYSDCTDGLRGWTVRGLEPCPWEGFYDDSAGHEIHSTIRPDGKFLCEGSYLERTDGIHMLLRSAERVLYESVSRDNGESWSAPSPTAFTDCGSKFHCGRLPDGRYYIVSNPDAEQHRARLILSVSEDGESFCKGYIIADEPRTKRYTGLYKGGLYGYPHSLLTDGWMHVICSINKEDIRVFSFPLEHLD